MKSPIVCGIITNSRIKLEEAVVLKYLAGAVIGAGLMIVVQTASATTVNFQHKTYLASVPVAYASGGVGCETKLSDMTQLYQKTRDQLEQLKLSTLNWYVYGATEIALDSYMGSIRVPKLEGSERIILGYYFGYLIAGLDHPDGDSRRIYIENSLKFLEFRFADSESRKFIAGLRAKLPS